MSAVGGAGESERIRARVRYVGIIGRLQDYRLIGRRPRYLFVLLRTGLESFVKAKLLHEFRFGIAKG